MTFQLFAALSAAAALSATLGSAAAAPAPRPMTVSYAGLDLATAKGHAEAVRRIQRAAAGRCSAPEAMEGFEGYDACIKAAVSAASAALPVVAGEGHAG